MSTLHIHLSQKDSERLAALAAREGLTLEQTAEAAVKARLNADTAAHREVEAGLAELDAGEAMTMDEFEREMDAVVASLAAERA